MDELNPTVARLCRAFFADERQDRTVTLMWAKLASELIKRMTPEDAAMIEARLDAVARAAEQLPPGASVHEIVGLADVLRQLKN